MLIIGGWSAEVAKSRIVWQASRPVVCSLPQSFTHCGSGDTRSTLDGIWGCCGPAGAPGAGAAGFAGAFWASAARAERHAHCERRGAQARDREIHQSSFQAVNGESLRARAVPHRAAFAPGLRPAVWRQYDARRAGGRRRRARALFPYSARQSNNNFAAGVARGAGTRCARAVAENTDFDNEPRTDAISGDKLMR